MKKSSIVIALCCLVFAQDALARDGYHITLKMSNVRDSLVYLVHYYGQNRPHIYIADSARFDKKGTAVFDSRKTDFVGGIYIILLKDTARTNFEFLLNKGDDISITAQRKYLPGGITFKGSPENDRFKGYLDFIKEYGAEQKKLEQEYKEAKTTADTSEVRKKAAASARSRAKYTRDYARAYPNTLLAEVFNAMELPEIPDGPHFLSDGVTKDSTFSYRYYKEHYWDNFNFQDDRLIYTPIYDGKIEEYMSRMVVPSVDSMEKECDMLLTKAKGTKDMFHYTLFWLTRYVETSKIMGMDEVFVYLVENYFMKGDAFWLTNDELSKYIERAKAIAPNVIGNLAPELKVQNVITGNEESLLGVRARYTLLIFYSPTCGHCEHELPLIDSVYEAVLKGKGVKVFTLAIDGDQKAVTDFLVKKKLDTKWTNTWDPDRHSDFRSKYDVYSTPTIYLFDEKKIIRGKRLDHGNVAGLIEMLEKKEALKIVSQYVQANISGRASIPC